MLPMSPLMFASVISGALRLGKEAHRAYREGQVERQDFALLIPDLTLGAAVDPHTLAGLEKINKWASEAMIGANEHLPGRRYAGIFLLDHNQQPVRDPVTFLPVIIRGAQEAFEAAVVDFLSISTYADREDSRGAAQASMFVYQQKLWNNPEERSVWGRFFRHFVDVAFDVIAIQPGALGISGNVETFAQAMFPNLAQIYEAEQRNDPDVERRSRLANIFAEATLKTIADNPGLVTTQQRWEVLISGVLSPLQEEVSEHGFSALLAERRIRDLVGGPMAYAALTAVAERPDEFLKGGFSQSEVLGQVARETLGAFVSTKREGARVREIFSDAGAMTIFRSVLKVAGRRPELFVAADPQDSPAREAAQSLLSGVANVLYEADPPFDRTSGLGPRFAEIGLDVIETYSTARFASGVSADRAALRGELVGSVLSSIVAGLASPSSSSGRSALARTFSAEQAMDLVSIIARHAAKSPHLVVGRDVSPEVSSLAAAIAGAIAADDDGLMNAKDWRGVITVTLETAHRNPGRLFGVGDTVSPSDAIATSLIARLIGVAKEAFREPGPETGKLMFGETLASALRITMVAAGSGALAAIRDTAGDEDRLEQHLDGVANLARRLNRLSASTDPEMVISADDWLRIYAMYIATALERGSVAINDTAPSDEALLAALGGGLHEMGGGAPR